MIINNTPAQNKNIPDNLTWTPVVSKSGNIISSAFDGVNTYVTFKNGTRYRSSDVSLLLYQEFLATHASPEDSTGAFYNQHLRPLNFTKIPEDADENTAE